MAAYIVFTRIKTIDSSELQLYWDGIHETMKGHPIEMLAIYGQHEMLEGSPPVEGVVIAKFPDMTSAKQWYGSEAYQNVSRHRRSGAIYHGLIVEGV